MRISRRTLLGSTAMAPLIAAPSRAASTFVDILRPPDIATAWLEKDSLKLQRSGSRYTAPGIAVSAEPGGAETPVRIEAPELALMRVQLRWKARVPESWRILNDQWERSYGDLEWRGINGDRVLPWYFLAFDKGATHGYGVRTGASCFAFWQVDPEGISLWLDVRNGGSPAHLGARTLDAVVIRSRRGKVGESAFASAQAFCRDLCQHPRLPAQPCYGGNNWYYTYGQNCSAQDILRDSRLLMEWAPSGANRPFMVIDDGWAPNATAGPWDRGNDRFPDMAQLAASMSGIGVRPGIWTRPLYTKAQVPTSWTLRPGTLDATVPEVVDLVRTDTRRVVEWGYRLLKHDFTSYDILGRWGFAMNAELTNGGWHFHDRSRTTAEIVLALYRAIRESAGEALVIGCNTFGHLGAGWFELQRTGDDTSGREFHRTRRMGVNTLAFRAPQHGTFFALDADCAPITPQIPWNFSAQWLDLLARSGTALFVSADPAALNPESRAAIRRAFAAAALPQSTGEPLDWMDTTTPARWRLNGRSARFDWFGDAGGTPFPR